MRSLNTFARQGPGRAELLKLFYPPWNREALLERLQAGVQALRAVLPLDRVVLFGSYSRGRQTVASDVDLLVVYAGVVRDDTHALVKRTLNIRHLEPHVYAAEEYAQVRETLERMVQGGIVVYSSKPEPGPVTIATV